VNIADTAEDLATFFEQHSKRFAVIGGFALIAHGIQRATFDLDLLVESDIQQTLIAFLESRGYQTLHRSSGFSNHLHASAAMGRLDFVYVDGHTAEAVFASSVETAILGDIRALVPKPEHLIAMKLRAIKNDPSRRLQDLADIQQLSRLSGVDQDQIRAYFTDLELTHLYEELQADAN